jgi:hypothetical protein
MGAADFRPADLQNLHSGVTPLRKNYVLIDYENLQPKDIAVLDQDHFRILLFVGASQSKIPFELAAEMQRMGERAQYIKISGNGSNALDFHIAFHIGLIAAQEPDAYFHIISKDGGFDPLIQHLKSRKIFANRSKEISEIPLLRISNTKTLDEKVLAIVANLKQRAASKPRTMKTLSSTVASLFQKQLPEEELGQLLKLMQSRGFIAVTENKVAYSLPATP